MHVANLARLPRGMDDIMKRTIAAAFVLVALAACGGEPKEMPMELKNSNFGILS
jgi:hypothetical protein